MIRGRTSMKYVFQIMRILKVYIESFTSKTSKKGYVIFILTIEKFAIPELC